MRKGERDSRDDPHHAGCGSRFLADLLRQELDQLLPRLDILDRLNLWFRQRAGQFVDKQGPRVFKSCLKTPSIATRLILAAQARVSDRSTAPRPRGPRKTTTRSRAPPRSPCRGRCGCRTDQLFESLQSLLDGNFLDGIRVRDQRQRPTPSDHERAGDRRDVGPSAGMDDDCLRLDLGRQKPPEEGQIDCLPPRGTFSCDRPK